MKPIVIALPGNELLAEKIIAGIEGEKGDLSIRKFPDQESYVRVISKVEGREVVVVCSLHQPDVQVLQLFFLCSLLKDLKARNICLVSPYLAYMRQDKRFQEGEAITSEYFAILLSSIVDYLITVDPHLHRHRSLSEIYSIPSAVIHAAAPISEWIKNHIEKPVLIGPDSESEQWVSEVAGNASIPYLILEKIRKGDTEVKVSVPKVEKFKDHTPVLVDDIISTAKTMIETVKQLNLAGMKPPVCIGVHAVFANNAYQELLRSEVKEVITCNTIVHESNKIDLSALIIKILKINAGNF